MEMDKIKKKKKPSFGEVATLKLFLSGFNYRKIKGIHPLFKKNEIFFCL